MLLKNKLIANNGVAVFVLVTLVSLAILDMGRLAELQDKSNLATLSSGNASNNAYLGARMYSVVADTLINQDFVQSKKDWAEVKAVSLKEMDEVIALTDTAEQKMAAEKANAALNTYIDLYENQYLQAIHAAKKDQLTQ